MKKLLITLTLSLLIFYSFFIPCNSVFARTENAVQVSMELYETDQVCAKAPRSLNPEPLSAESPRVESDTQKRDFSGFSFSAIIMVIVIPILLYFYAGMFRMVYETAQRNNRDSGVWLILSFITTPIVTLFLLRHIGDE